MKLTKTRLKQIIKEELQNVLKEEDYVQNYDPVEAAQDAWRGSKDHIEYEVEKSALNIDEIINTLKRDDKWKLRRNPLETLINVEKIGSEEQLRDWIRTYYNEYKIIKDKRVATVPNSETWYFNLMKELEDMLFIEAEKEAEEARKESERYDDIHGDPRWRHMTETSK